MPEPAAVPLTPPRPASRKWEWLVAFSLGILLVLLIQWLGTSPKPPLAFIPASVDLNTATVESLAQLPGVGPQLAARIIENRNQFGPFHSVEDLRRITGVGPVISERIKPWVQVTFASTPETPPPLRTLKSDSSTATKLDINTASKEELLQLPGVGNILAERILEDREKNGPFRTVQELTRVKGLKEKTLQKLLPLVEVVAKERGKMS